MKVSIFEILVGDIVHVSIGDQVSTSHFCFRIRASAGSSELYTGPAKFSI